MRKTSIMSDTKGKLKKMITGVVFSDTYVFVTEFFQNSYRARAKRVEVLYNQYEGTIIFKDNGKGLKKASDILTLDYSSWESTTEGFGIGFWSWLGFDLPENENDFTEVVCSVKSNKFSFEISKLELLKSKLDVEIEEIEDFEGFEVMLSSELLKSYDVANAIKERIFNDGSLMPYDVYYNGIRVEPKDILGEVSGAYVKNFSNRLFEARLTVSRGYNPISLYYEKRKVVDFYNQSYVSGNIELKKGALNLKEPDRKDYVRDRKYYSFREKISECSKELYKDFLENASEDLINEYATNIAEILDVKDYEKLLEIEDILLELEEETRTVIEPISEPINELNTLINSRNQDVESNCLDTEHCDVNMLNISKLLNVINVEGNKKWVQTEEVVLDESVWVAEELNEEVLKEKDKVVIKGRVWKKLDGDDYNSFSREDESVETEITIKSCKKSKKKASLLEVIKKERKKVWVKASEVSDMEELIAKSKYYGLKVFMAKNVLYENVFKSKGIAHISEVNTGITKRNVIKNVEIKSNKEKCVLQLLQPICTYYNLSYDTFLIGDLEIYLETKLQDVVVHREVLKNTKEHIKIYGVTDGSNIILDRKSLRLRRFNLTQSEGFGKQEFRVLLALINTVSHELAHFLYGTTDNTVEHFEKQDKIMEEIETLYNSL